MSWILDISIVTIAVFSVIIAAKRGFIRTLISSVSFALAVLVTVLFASSLANIFTERISARVEDVAETKIKDIMLENSLKIEDLFENKSEKFDSLCEKAGVDRKQILGDLQPSEISTREIARRITSPIVKTVSMLTASLLLFIGTKLGLDIAAFVLGKIFELPLLKTADKRNGVLLGILLGFLRISMFCFAVKVLMAISDFLGSSFVNSLNTDSTLIFKFFADLDIFGFFIK